MSEASDWLVIKNLVLLVRRLVVSLRRCDADDYVAEEAMNYLERFEYANHVNGILRDTSFPAPKEQPK